MAKCMKCTPTHCECYGNLNLEQEIERLTRKALRIYKSPKEASKHLGVTDRTIYRMIERYNIEWEMPLLESNQEKK